MEGKSHQGIAFIMIGGPGSGKNTIKNMSIAPLGLDEKTFALIDTDIILDTFYDNKESCRTSANHINDFSFDTMLEKHIDFIYCATGRNPETFIPNVIQRTKKSNYKVYLSIVANTSETAIPRVIKRTLDTGRNFNIEIIKNIYSTLEKDILTYMDLECSDVDGIFVIDNSSTTPQLLYTSTCENDIKSVKCYDVSHNYTYITEFCPSFWNDVGRMISNGIIVAALIGITVYVVITYKLHWAYVFLISTIVPYYTAKWKTHRHTIKESVIISLVTAIFVFFILLRRFTVSESVGISMVVGGMTGTTWHMTK